ncbi:MAG: flagellar assembly protein A, partial [Spirochaetia bacterium]
MAKSDGTISGTIELLIDDDGVEARLRVTPKPDGETWTGADVVKLLTDRGVQEGYDASDVSRKLADAAKKARKQGGTAEVVVAEGLRPEQPKPERIHLREHPVPEDLKQAAEQTIAGAGPPEIVFERKKR